MVGIVAQYKNPYDIVAEPKPEGLSDLAWHMAAFADPGLIVTEESAVARFKSLHQDVMGISFAVKGIIFALSNSTSIDGKKQIDLKERVTRGKHPADTGIWDENGSFVPQRFEEVIKNYSSANIDGEPILTSDDLKKLIKDDKDRDAPKCPFNLKEQFTVIGGKVAADLELPSFAKLLNQRTKEGKFYITSSQLHDIYTQGPYMFNVASRVQDELIKNKVPTVFDQLLETHAG